MPVIVVGADTATGNRLIEALVDTDQEVRAFITDRSAVAALRSLGVKVAIGDVSDSSHISGACTNAFTAVLVTEAAADERERSFAEHYEEVLRGWVEAVEEAGVDRVIWVSERDAPRARVPEEAVVDPTDPDAVRSVVRLDEAGSIPPRE